MIRNANKPWVWFIGLLILAVMSLGAIHYGYGAASSYTAATADTGETITDAHGQTFTWTTPRRHVIICNAPTSGANLYVKLNSSTCDPSSSAYDFVIPGSTTWSGFVNTQLVISSLTLYADASCTVGTDVVVTGVD
jgi:hypothetical protein